MLLGFPSSAFAHAHGADDVLQTEPTCQLLLHLLTTPPTRTHHAATKAHACCLPTKPSPLVTLWRLLLLLLQWLLLLLLWLLRVGVHIGILAIPCTRG
jgi:hypothetical protein